MPHPDIWTFIMHSSLVVKLVLLVLLLASITSWTIIFQRIALLRQRKKDDLRFQTEAFSDTSAQELVEQLSAKENSLAGLARIYFEGLNAFICAVEDKVSDSKIGALVSRAMRIAHNKELDDLEKNLSLLATIGSNAVYVGLLGTVWGVMSAFEGLGLNAQSTIATVAPGIAEALIATAMGLIVAIPAVIAYNLFTSQIETMETSYHILQDKVMLELADGSEE
jgi:biopolymer transport protein TolQ